ncbi:MAG TPA: pilus assembly protein N-terminal domain-containing protein [Terriglobales bacterium]|nr:pilus assembly protein N-terminal domain-containing protein [Terriglobales bacterium]
MSRRRIHLMRALIEGILAGLALLALGGLRVAVAETPKPAPSPRKLLTSLQGSFAPLTFAMPVRVMPLATSAARESGTIEAPRLIELPRRTVTAPAPALAFALSDPAALMLAMRDAALPPPTVAPVATAKPAPAPLTISAAAWPAATAAAPARAVATTAIALQLTPHHSLVLQSPVPLTRVSITDDSIAQAIVISPTQVLVQGRAPGEVSLLLWDANAVPAAYTVEVGLDPMPLQRELLRLYPHQLLRVTASGNALTVTGTMPNTASAKQVMAVAAGFGKDVVNNLSVDAAGDPAQVLLQVRFAEVDRSAVTQLGANLLSTGKGMVGTVSTGQFGPATGVTAPPPQQVPQNSVTGNGGTLALDNLLNIFLYSSSANIGLTLEALQQRNLLQILAEPNLMAMDGKEASFLAGGEFPFPVVQGQGSVNNVTIQFKPFGVNLHFKPTILPDGTIDLEVAPEVSALDFSNALTVSGFQIPALSTRRAETELELGDGQSFVIAGLLDNRLTTNLSKLPGLSSIPILGKFFQSQNTSKSRNELVVVVTAHLVHPANSAASGPAMPQPFLGSEQFDGKGGAKVVHP